MTIDPEHMPPISFSWRSVRLGPGELTSKEEAEALSEVTIFLTGFIEKHRASALKVTKLTAKPGGKA